MKSKLKFIVVTCILLAASCFCGCFESFWHEFYFTKTNANDVVSVQMLERCGVDGTTPDDENSVKIQNKYFRCVEELEKSEYNDFLYDLSKYGAVGVKEKGLKTKELT